MTILLMKILFKIKEFLTSQKRILKLKLGANFKALVLIAILKIFETKELGIDEVGMFENRTCECEVERLNIIEQL